MPNYFELPTTLRFDRDQTTIKAMVTYDHKASIDIFSTDGTSKERCYFRYFAAAHLQWLELILILIRRSMVVV
jgi:hypothetical protein